MRKSVLFSLSLASALLVSASFPPFNLGILAWFGLAPLLFALRQRGSAAAASLGFVFGCLFGIGAFYPALSNAIDLSYFLLLLLIPFVLYFLTFGFFYTLISKSVGSWIILGAPALWVALEFARANFFFLSFPWNLLGHSQYNYPSNCPALSKRFRNTATDYRRLCSGPGDSETVPRDPRCALCLESCRQLCAG